MTSPDLKPAPPPASAPFFTVFLFFLFFLCAPGDIVVDSAAAVAASAANRWHSDSMRAPSFTCCCFLGVPLVAAAGVAIGVIQQSGPHRGEVNGKPSAS